MNALLPTALLGCVVGLCPRHVWAQRNPMMQQFSASTVVLNSGDTLRGPVVLRQDMDMLLLTLPDQTVRTVPALSVRTFAVRGEILPFDQLPPQYAGRMGGPRARRRWHDVQRARPFLVFPWNHDKDELAASLAPAFFERLNGGPVILLRRQRLVQRSMSVSDLSAGYAVQRTGPQYYYTDVQEAYYLATPDGRIVALRRPRHDLLEYFGPEAAQLEQYAREQNLSFTDSLQLARLVDYANTLRHPQL